MMVGAEEQEFNPDRWFENSNVRQPASPVSVAQVVELAEKKKDEFKALASNAVMALRTKLASSRGYQVGT